MIGAWRARARAPAREPSGMDGPITYNRAATALVRSRRGLEQARDDLRLALEILRQLEAGTRRSRQASKRVTASLAEVLERLEDVTAALARSQKGLA